MSRLREFLDIDAGALLTPTDYPYPPHVRPIRPVGARDTVRLSNIRAARQLFPPHGGVVRRLLGHVTFAGIRNAQQAATRSASGAATPAKSTRRRPWLFS